jgi:dipeptidyl aminopeptidase/acylaminoacyl peptidase
LPDFTDPSAFASIPRLGALRLSPDGTWLAATVQATAGEPPRYVTSIWRIPVSGAGSPARLTRSAEGEGSPAFLPDGSLLFTSARPAPPAPGGDAAQSGPGAAAAPQAPRPAVWLLPAGGGEARRIAAPPGGADGVTAARSAAVFACRAGVMAGAADARDDAARRKARADAGVNAILHEDAALPRFWDHDLGPDIPRLLAAAVPADTAAGAQAGAGEAEPRDLTPDAVPWTLEDHSFDVTPDGSAVVAGWTAAGTAPGEHRMQIVVLPVAGGERRTLLAAPDAHFQAPRVAPDGGQVLAFREQEDTYDRPGELTLVLVPLAGGEPRNLLAGFDRWPVEAAWAPDSRAIYFTADDHGRRPVFRADLAAGEVTRITPDDAAYSSLCPAPDGSCLYALRDAVNAAPAPVRIGLAPVRASTAPAGTAPASTAPASTAQDSTAPGSTAQDDGQLTWLASPVPALDLPGQLTEVQAAAEDGTPIRGWLVLPAGASAQAPAPLVLWVHGGPQSSWNSWSWRWNPWLMAARGYAVLLPDPALSTGYGQAMMERGHGTWGAAPFTDVMAVTDAVVKRADIDDTRTAMMGGSFGGYMANWIAGHTSRFRAIVSHAGVWDLDQMFGTTDFPEYWRRVFGDPVTQPGRYQAWSPHLHVADIVTPMLVIHGDKDYRVPVGEALRLWTDLSEHGKTARFLYFPEENHWILKPGDVPVWYETVFAFLAEHVLGEPWQRPAHL